jgi:hypothetical protein
LFKALKSGTGVKIGVKIMTTIYTPLSSFPYEFEQEQILKK